MNDMRKKRYKAKYYKKSSLSVRHLIVLLVLIVVIVLAVIAAFSHLEDQLEKIVPVVSSDAASSDEQTVFQTESTPAEQNSSAQAETIKQESSTLKSEEPVLTPEEQKYQQVKQRAEENCTNTQPVVTDPALWQKQADQILETLENDPYYQNFGIDLNYMDNYPYLLAVNREASTITVYAVGEDERYTVPFMAMVCSGGEDTPLGYYQTPVNYQWRLLSGPCYGQYATRIWDAYLFHSVPYYTQHKDDLEYIEYNKLGTLASLGCIRLQTVDVKWIFDHCPIGTKVVIYDDAETPGPMGKPGTILIDSENEALRGWDPTDPDPENPWDEQYRTGTAIRSDEAWKQYDQELAASVFVSTINPTDLQGWSHDYTTEGTRG